MPRAGWIRTANPGWLTALAATCAGVGLLSGINPSLGLVAAIGLAFAACVVTDLTLGLVLFTVITFIDASSLGATFTNITKLAGLLLVASWLASSATRSRRDAATLAGTTPVLAVAAILLLCWSALSLAWAESPGQATSSTERYLLNLMLLPIVFGAIRRREHIKWVVSAFVIGAVASALWGFAQGPVASADAATRLTGGIGDANELAAVLAAAVALAIALALSLRRGSLRRSAAFAGAALALVALMNTLSRSGLIALACIMLAAVAFGGRWRRHAAVVLLIGSAAVVTYFAVLASSTARQRVTSQNTSGRSDIWKIGWRMFQANPALGVGSGNFQVSAVHYVQQPGAINRADLIVDAPHVAHNIYLEVLDDLGIPGLLILLTLCGSAIAAAVAAAAVYERNRERDYELFARATAVAIVGILAADFFLSGEYSKQLWLLLALPAPMLAVARAQPQDVAT